LGLGDEFDEDYPVIFNILLWLGVSLAIATLAVCGKDIKNQPV